MGIQQIHLATGARVACFPCGWTLARDLLGADAMPVSGLVVTLDDDGGRGESALVRLSDRRIAIGKRVGNRVPVVTDTDTIAEARELLETIEGLDGVLTAAVVSIDFSEAEARGAYT